MSGSDSNTDTFDVFLCHNSADKPEVREIASKLRSQGLKPWLDERDILPGELWQEALEEQIKKSKAAAILVGDNGIGQWQKEEVEAFLKQAKKRRCVIIPVILPSATRTPEFPIFLQNRQQVDLRTAVQDPYGLLKKVITGETPVDQVTGETVLLTPLDHADKLNQAYQEGRRLFPALPAPPDHEQRTQLRILLDRVQAYWVEGVLGQSLHHEEPIELGKEVKEQAVELPWKYVAPLPSALRELLLHNRNIITLFDATGLLLILGEPGSGKTTSLLELAKGLITRAKDDPTERVPIVLNLSSWEQAQSLEEWIAAELSAKYRIPKSIAGAWLAQDYLVPLLDGLDELPSTVQPACVAAINAFVKSRQPSGLVVCSRLAEYEWLSERLTLNGAVCIEPLSPEDVNQFLETRGAKLEGLQQALSNDPVLSELSQTPLMLDIMSVACVGVSKEALVMNETDSPEMRQQHIFHRYVEQMLERKEWATNLFEKGHIIGWLSLLARKMKKQSQSIFMVEEVQPSWLNSKGQWFAYQAVISLWVTVLCWLVVWMSDPTLGAQRDTLITGLVCTLALGLSVFFGCRSFSTVESGILCALLGTFFTGAIDWIFLNGASPAKIPSVLSLAIGNGMVCGIFGGLGIGSVCEINLVETIRWQWWLFVKKAALGTMVGYILVGPLFLLTVYWIVILIALICMMVSIAPPMGGSSWGLLGVIFLILLFLGPFFGFIFGLNSASINAVRVHKATPNQGIWLSLKNGLTTLLLFITAWMVCWFLPFSVFSAYGLPSRPNGESDTVGLLFSILMSGLVIGSIVFLSFGGSAVLKHYALRLILWLTGATPSLPQFIPFLDHCAKLILLKKVGGGYIFIHRTLLEYFAGLPSQTPKTSSRDK
ncbi:MAG: TIR domain-containing protein [Nitrospira sp.]|nr:TIR domain-containing protein [Nitrospira sp.]